MPYRCPSLCAARLPHSSPSSRPIKSSRSACATVPIRKRWRAAARDSRTTMSGEKSFLARWSRRKREAIADRRDHTKPANTGNSAAVPDTAVPPAPPIEAPPLVDPISLPPIESIGPGSDLRAFLAAGVPADLTRAALRRAWSAEPAIRDFIGLSESSWDFNAAGGVPGFGAMTAEEGRRLLAQAMGEPKAADQACPAGSTTLTDQATPPAGEPCPATQGA